MVVFFSERRVAITLNFQYKIYSKDPEELKTKASGAFKKPKLWWVKDVWVVKL